jgi:hypothetical protein
MHVFVGRWRITETEMWDRDALDLVVPAHITLGRGGFGEMQLIAIDASVDYRVVTRGETPHVEFSWRGFDDSRSSCGRGWARLDEEKLVGELFIHEGDDSAFVATRDADQDADPRGATSKRGAV